jgi:hypothetical protein
VAKPVKVSGTETTAHRNWFKVGLAAHTLAVIMTTNSAPPKPAGLFCGQPRDFLSLLVVVFELGLLLLLHDRLIATRRHCRLLFFGKFQPGLSHVD